MSLRTFITNNKSKQKTLYKNYNESQFGDRLKAMNGVGKIFILFLSSILILNVVQSSQRPFIGQTNNRKNRVQIINPSILFINYK